MNSGADVKSDQYGNGGAAFDCKMCGQCCQGEGGIVMSPMDRARLAAHVGMELEPFLAQFSVSRNGKVYLRTRQDGYCVYFSETGCSVHQGKPDICRAWPFFRGNLVDEQSWFMAQEYCPGINPDAGHAQFVCDGVRYLRGHGLVREDGDDDGLGAGALRIPPNLGKDCPGDDE